MSELSIPTGWEQATLGDLFSFKGGGTPSKKNPEYWDGDIPWASVKDIKSKYLVKTQDFITSKGLKESASNLAEPGDLVVLTRIEPGKVSIVKNSVAVNQDCKIATPKSNVNVKWAYYLFLAIENEFLKRSSGTTVLGIRLNDINEIPVVLPPIHEQELIVDKIEELLSELDTGIESLKTAREQLKVYRQAVLKHAFEGKLTAQWRERNKDKLESPEQLLARLQHEREARYQQQLEEWKAAVKAWEAGGKAGKKPGKPKPPTAIRHPVGLDFVQLPQGWCWIEYDGLCEHIRNGISAKPDGKSGAKIFRISAVRAMEFDLNDVRYIANTDGQYDEYFLTTGDLVFTRYNGSRNYVGVCAEYRGHGDHLYPDKLIQTRLGVRSISSTFLEGAMNCGESRRFIESRIRTTAGQSGVSGSDIRGIPVPVCCVDEQRVIEMYLSDQLSTLNRTAAEIERSLSRAEVLRQSVLKNALIGQLTK